MKLIVDNWRQFLLNERITDFVNELKPPPADPDPFAGEESPEFSENDPENDPKKEKKNQPEESDPKYPIINGRNFVLPIPGVSRINAGFNQPL